jgi:nucleoside 2-deoxyribosyltransferase
MQTTYLSGTIDSGSDLGRGWRDSIKPRLRSLYIKVLDPTDTLNFKKIDLQKQIIDTAKAESNWQLFIKEMDTVWSSNKKSVESCDFLIAHFTHPPESWGGGTLREFQVAFELHKPVYLVYEQNVGKIKNHILHMVLKYGKLFQTFDELFAYLGKVTVKQR